MLTDPAPAAYYVRVAGIAPAVVEAIYGYGKVVDERYDGCAYFVERADERRWPRQRAQGGGRGRQREAGAQALPEEAEERGLRQ